MSTRAGTGRTRRREEGTRPAIYQTACCLVLEANRPSPHSIDNSEGLAPIFQSSCRIRFFGHTGIERESRERDLSGLRLQSND